MKRWLPSPLLSLALFVVWLLLNQSLHAATLLLAALLAIAVPLLTQSLRPARVKMRKPFLAIRLGGVVAFDLVVSAFTVARLLLTRRSSEMSPRFVHVPLAMRDPNALATLAMILCLTPGTAWGEIALDRATLLIHVFDEDDAAAFIEMIKTRYERPLMEIFES
ncbi:Na+/H+ antiporter subunit E [Variovorax sp. PBL-H6]|uniref:Na+/H+ antiporter subunit E n=1 Tax=Variovorax sp. PBL-H6 TaxID=434009 RepID=UPI0013A5968E|nr:Na+/H+ antiporter subunit E [Variovorax sp. PBL-H6]